MTTIFSQVVAHKKLHRNVDFFERLIPITEMKDSTKANQGMIQQLRHVKDQIDDLLVELNREVDNNANSFTNQDFLGIYSFF